MTKYPLPAFHFEVHWQGSNVGFSEVSGLNAENQLIEYREGSSKQYSTIKMPGLQKSGNITLKRGVSKADNEFFTWLSSVALNTIERRTIVILLLNEDHDPVVTWTLNDAWPIKVDGPSLKANGNEVAVESIEIAHEGIKVING